MISDYAHRTQIERQEQNPAHVAELIKQELVGVGGVASQYAEEARKASSTLNEVYAWLQELLQSSKVDTASDSAVATDSAVTADSATVTNSTTACNPTTSNSPIALPDVIVRTVLGGHICECQECKLDLAQRLYDKAKNDLIEAQVVRLTKAGRERILLEVRTEELAEIRIQVRSEVQELPEHEMRTEIWDNHREASRKQLAEEMLPGLREQAQEKANAELREKLKAENTVQILAENRKWMLESGRF